MQKPTLHQLIVTGAVVWLALLAELLLLLPAFGVRLFSSPAGALGAAAAIALLVGAAIVGAARQLGE